MTRRKGLIGAALVVAAAFIYLVYGGIGDNLVYFLSPGELLARNAQMDGGPVRLGGTVKPGSVQWNAAELDLRFVLTDAGGASVPVHSAGAPPQMFRDGMGVVVEGRLTPAGVFESHNLMVMHGNEYRRPGSAGTPRHAFRKLEPR